MTRAETNRAPTIRDIAAAAGVSAATAARALGAYGSVSPDTREAVAAAAARLGYRANSLARSMITGTTNTLALVVADIENPFFARACRGFTDAARSLGFEVIVANTDEDVEVERSAVKVMLEKRIDGIVVAPASTLEYDHIEAAQGAGVAVVLIDRHIPRLAVDSVLVDSRKAADHAITHLIEHGHSRIALVTGASADEALRPEKTSQYRTSTTQERVQGYRSALRRAGIDLVPAYLKFGDFHRESAREMAGELLDLDVPPTAIFTTDSVITLGVLEALQAARIAIPQEMSLLGFDDPEWSLVVRPALTVIAQPAYDIGTVAAQRVIAQIRGGTQRPRRNHLPTQLVIRDSVADISGRS
jgi:LacI family transcriptional regulator